VCEGTFDIQLKIVAADTAFFLKNVKCNVSLVGERLYKFNKEIAAKYDAVGYSPRLFSERVGSKIFHHKDKKYAIK
jgi:hypothetical protein